MRTALIVATDTYADPTFGALRAPQHDAAELDRVLADPAIGAFSTELLVNTPFQRIRERIDEVFSRAGSDDLVLLYLSGHGVKDRTGKLHFAAGDTRRDLLPSTSVPAQFVREMIDHSPARKVVVWLDCCYGGAFPSGMLPRAAGSVDVVEQLDEGRGCAVMTASTHIQYAYEPDGVVRGETEPSVFTKAIIEGLRTGAADADGDGEITAQELYDFVYRWVRRESPDQTPTRSGTVSGDLRIAYAGTPLPAGLPDEVRYLLRSNDPTLRSAGVRILVERAATDPIAEAALAVLTRNGSAEVAEAAQAPVVPAPPIVRKAVPDEGLVLRHGAALDGSATHVAFSPVDPVLATSDAIWDTTTWQRKTSLPPGIKHLAFSADGRLLAVDRSGGIEILSTWDWEVLVRIHRPARAGRLAFGHDGRTLLWWRPGGQVWTWTREDDQWLMSVDLGPEDVRAVAVSSGKPLAVLLTDRHELRLWDLEHRTPVGEGRRVDSGVRDVALSPDGTLIATLSTRRPELRRASDLQGVRAFDMTGHVLGSVGFSPSGRTLAISGMTGVHLWDVASGELRQVLPVGVKALAFSPDDRFAVGTSPDRRIRLWTTGPDLPDNLRVQPPASTPEEQWRIDRRILLALTLALVAGVAAAVLVRSVLVLSWWADGLTGLAVAGGVGRVFWPVKKRVPSGG
ncbi:caspase family protein [Actinosynnema sp. NPDC047251]|uniref:Peptidase C14 caspase domain-containing protein n=1 Tax=Saccharothrix espanaensis (strain ATCC 51144 / DSM 44229 / JCM 9112 / NBRC 15066 / NRRL 15764) TaxID=1179773 RepID=K0KDT0_SACES|nr:caspase family protein [Saccharothrix espanaensis]CCH34939.1 hypothetical protein BN6_77190 [Saccharothrix espanaensis DSM 44229]